MMVTMAMVVAMMLMVDDDDNNDDECYLPNFGPARSASRCSSKLTMSLSACTGRRMCDVW